MTDLESESSAYLEENFEEIRDTLERYESPVMYASDLEERLETDTLNTKQLGKLLKYLSAEGIIDHEELTNSNCYDISDFETSDLEKLREEELE